MGVTGHELDAIASANAGIDEVGYIWASATSIMDLDRQRKLAIDLRTAGRLLEQGGTTRDQETPTRSSPRWWSTMWRGQAIAKWLYSPSAEALQQKAEILGDQQPAPAAVRIVTGYTEKLVKRAARRPASSTRVGYAKAVNSSLTVLQAGGILKEGWIRRAWPAS